MFKREDRHALQGAAAERVEHAENAAGLLLEGIGVGGEIDARQRDVGAEPVDDECGEREPQALLQVLGLGEGRKIEIGG